MAFCSRGTWFTDSVLPHPYWSPSSRETIGTPLKWVTANGWSGHCSGAFPTGDSINEVSWRFQPCRISDLELVAQNSASWNQLAGWLREIAALREAA
jgi:hypothetical protein